MINALFACGPNGEFGLKGKLPWGSFKEELEVFRATLRTAKNGNVIVGIKTWEGLPISIKKLLADLNIQVYLFVPNPMRNVVALHKYWGNLFIITNFDVSLDQFLGKDKHTLILGGASTLKLAMDAGLLDGIYISRIWSKDQTSIEADTYLADELFNTETMPEATVFLNHYAENEKYAFVQEYYFFGTV